MPTILQHARSRTNLYRNAVLLVGGAIAVASIAFAPVVFATHLSTGGADVAVDLRMPLATVVIDTVGAFEGVSLPTSPTGARLLHGTAYELTIVAISTNAGSTGYGYVGDATAVEIVNESSGAVLTSSPLASGPTADTRNATFVLTSLTILGPGLYQVRAVGSASVAANLLFYPKEDLTLTISPSPVAYTPSGTVLTVNASRPSTGLTDDGVGFLPAPAQTGADGTFAFVSSLPMGVGTWRVWAYANDSGPQLAPSGRSIPESLVNTTLTVAPGALTVSTIDASAGPLSSTPVVYRPAYASGNAVFRVSGGSFPLDASVSRFNLSVTTPHSLVVSYNQTMLPATSGNVTLAPSGCLNLSTGSTFCGTALPTVIVARDTGDVSIRAGDDVGGSDVWSNGPYTFALGLEVAGGAATAPEYAAMWTFVPTTPAPPPASARLSIANVTGGPLFAVANSIRLTNVTDFGAIHLNLSFNASVVWIENVTTGNIPEGEVTWNLNNTTGLLQIVVTTEDIPGTSGNFSVVNVTLRAVGPIGSTSQLSLTVAGSARSDGSALPLSIVNGTFRSGLLGDVTGDGLIDAQDVTRLAQHLVGIAAGPFEIANADINADGAVNVVDDLYLRQYVAGTRPTIP